MARKYVLGGQAATGLQAGIPYIRRINRVDSTPADGLVRPDGLTCAIDIGGGATDGAIRFDGANGQGVAWAPGTATTQGHCTGGELLMIEFPSTARSVTVTMEEAVLGGAAGTHQLRCQVMLSADGQDIQYAEATAVDAVPGTDGNFIEIIEGESATINSRTKVLFLRIQKFPDAVRHNVGGANRSTGVTAHADDTVVLLVTAVCDHENSVSSQQLEANSLIIRADSSQERLNEVWYKRDGIN